MRFLRMLTNSLLAGALGASYLTVLVLQLNPHIPIASDTTLRWLLTFVLFYGVHLAVLFYLLMMAREFFTLDTLSPGWASVRVLAWLAAALAAGAAALMWLNVQGFEAALGEVATRRMTSGAAATTASAVVLLGIAIAHYSFGRRGSRVGAALFAIATFGSLALPLAARGPAAPRPHAYTTPAIVSSEAAGPRVVMLLLDGASLEYIRLRAADGRLPNFSKLLDRGATLDLATVRPTGPGPVWTSVATGLYPAATGVRSGAGYMPLGASDAIDLLPDHCFSHALVHLGVVRQEPNTSEAIRARPLWNILSDAGITVGVVRWPLTYPASEVRGFMVSDRFHELLGSVLELDARAAFPETALPVVRQAFAFTSTSDEVAPAVVATTMTPDDDPESSATSRDRAYSRTLTDLLSAHTVRFAALRYQGLDTVGHYYMGDAQPALVNETNQRDRRRHLQVLDRYYAYIDTEVGVAVGALGTDDLLLVVSGFGMQRQKAIKQIAGRLLGDPDLSGTHDRAPDGFLLAYGSSVQSGHGLRGAVVDVAPTVLYFLGLPIGRDMDGYARTDIFTRAFTAERPVAYIPSYNR